MRGAQVWARNCSTTRGCQPAYRQYLEILVMVDGPEHTRLRTHVMRAFAPRRIAALRPRIERIVQDVTGELAAKGDQFDLLSAFAYPVMTDVICEIIGVDAADRPKVSGWIRDYESGEPDRFLPGIDHLAEYIGELLDLRGPAPRRTWSPICCAPARRRPRGSASHARR